MADLVNRERYGVAVDKKILEKFRELADKTRIPASKLTDEAFEDLIKKYEGLEAYKKEKQGGE